VSDINRALDWHHAIQMVGGLGGGKTVCVEAGVLFAFYTRVKIGFSKLVQAPALFGNNNGLSVQLVVLYDMNKRLGYRRRPETNKTNCRASKST
jgi:hypothetical protein